ncbi:MAG TPA: hypothetical protein VFK30_00670 [Anaerolineae bacterium]|nr:hypothetical protein [Anaerolineae bacterium]
MEENKMTHWTELLDELRSKDWMVACHNDYMAAGRRMTFWLFTHPCGLHVRGEGLTDAQAVALAAQSAVAMEFNCKSLFDQWREVRQ